ncbi:hypothetical protein ABBQ38_005407 [Trebouxia sp. C0009 RCD-2024]
MQVVVLVLNDPQRHRPSVLNMAAQYAQKPLLRSLCPRAGGVSPQALRGKESATGFCCRVVEGDRHRKNAKSTRTCAALKQASTVGADYFASDNRPVILFDGVCNLCNGAVNFLLDWDKDAQYRLAALQSKAGSELLQQAGRKPDDLSSVVLVEPGQAYVKSEAVLRIGRRLNTPFFVLGSMGLPVPSFIRDAAYDLVATTRYQVWGKTDSCRMCDSRFKERFIDD